MLKYKNKPTKIPIFRQNGTMSGIAGDSERNRISNETESNLGAVAGADGKFAGRLRKQRFGAAGTHGSPHRDPDPGAYGSAPDPGTCGRETSQSSGLSNFDVDSQEAEAFALLIQEAVAAEELEALAELAAYPLYLGFAEGGVSVQTAQELLDLGAERVFSPELTQAIAQAETAGLTASKAGFSLTKDGRPNILFGLRDGALAVQGINY